MPKLISRSVIEEIVRLRDEENLSFKEIGKKLGLNPETCSKHYREVKNKVKEKGSKAESHGSKILERLDMEIEDVKANIRACIEVIKNSISYDSPLRNWCLTELMANDLYPRGWFLDKGTDPVEIIKFQKWMKENNVNKSDVLIAKRIKKLAKENGLSFREFCERGIEAWEILDKLNLSIPELSTVYEVIKEVQLHGMSKSEFVKHLLKHKKLIFEIKELEKQKDELDSALKPYREDLQKRGWSLGDFIEWVNEREIDIEEMEEEYEELKKEIEELKREKVNYQREIEELDKENFKLLKENVELLQGIRVWKEIIDMLRNYTKDGIIQILERFDNIELSEIETKIQEIRNNRMLASYIKA